MGRKGGFPSRATRPNDGSRSDEDGSGQKDARREKGRRQEKSETDLGVRLLLVDLETWTGDLAIDGRFRVGPDLAPVVGLHSAREREDGRC
jgi:hypothetical protein